MSVNDKNYSPGQEKKGNVFNEPTDDKISMQEKDSESNKRRILEEKIKEYKRKKARPTTSHDYFHGHECHLDAENLSAYNIKSDFLTKFVFDQITVRFNDGRALAMYRSYAALGAEKYRHFTYHRFTIHPFSKLRLFLETIYLCFFLAMPLVLAIHYAKNDEVIKGLHANFFYFCDTFFIIYIIANLFTGYITGHCHKTIVLDSNKIKWHYIKGWLIVDLLCSLSFVPPLFNSKIPACYFTSEVITLMRLPSALKILQNLLVLTNVSTFLQNVIDVTVIISLYLAWNIYLQFSLEYTIEGSFQPEQPRACSWLTYTKVWNETWTLRFFHAIKKSVGMLTTNTNMKVIEELGCFEIFFVVSWLISRMVLFHLVLKYVIRLFGSESARAKYYIMQKQVEYYMNQRKLPPRLKKKILKFYAIRFQSKYFTESRLLNTMSGQLYDDILMHTGEQLIRELEFLKLLPRSLLMQVIFKLKVVIFIAGDIIYKINTIGDCLYFIDKGTVAIYSDSAQEICHIEDGDIFGEISLLLKHRFRVTSAVAVTNCELFKLDKEGYESTIAYYPNVYENLRKLAATRYERACVVDEHHKANLKTADMMENNDIQ